MRVLSRFVLDSLLREMHQQKASDLLLTAGSAPQLRINGILQPIGSEALTTEDTQALAASILNQEEMEALKVRRSLDISRSLEGLSRFRMNIFYQRDSVALAIRMIAFAIPKFADLGVPEIVKDFALRPHGLVLITGPAGSGKSTTLAAMIDYINQNRHVHVVCIEDPIEYLHHHNRSLVAQREIGSDAHSFSDALRSVFRQSPDVIMIGEMRDLETMQLALTLAETGHLILGTLHTQDTTHAVNRIVDVFPPAQQQQIYFQLSLVLVGVVSQQLLITKDGARRVLACEVMNVNNAIRNLIREMQVQQIYSVLETGRTQGMLTMNESLLDLYRRGLIDEDVALRRSPRPKELLRTLDSQPQKER